MYVLSAIVIALFWVVGVVTGIVTTIFYLELEDAYFYEPVRAFITNMQNLYARGVSGLISYPRRAFRSISNRFEPQEGVTVIDLRRL